MARTKETWNLNLNSALNVFTRNGKIALLVTDPEDTGRQIFVNLNCNPEQLAEQIIDKNTAVVEFQMRAAQEKKISSLKAILEGEFSPEMQEMALNTLIEMGVNV